MDNQWKALKKEFYDTGYVILNNWFEPELVERTRQDAHQYAGIDIFEQESIGDLLCHAKLVRFIAYLLQTADIAISPFRFWNHLSGGTFSDGGGWHVDDTWMANTRLSEILCMYYPQDVTEDMGPTMLLPGSHMRLYTPPQTAKLGWIQGQQKVVVKAGALAVTFPSILHAKAAHFSDKPRSMIKYGYEIADAQYGYYLTQEAHDNLRRTNLGRELTALAEVKTKEDSLWNSYWKSHESYTFQDFKHQIGVVGRARRKQLDHEKM